MKLKSLIFSLLSKKKAEAGEEEGGNCEESDEVFKNDLISRKKLCVVINIDNTLLDSLRGRDYAWEDHDYLSESGVQRSVRQGIFYASPELDRNIKLRPYIRTFLEKLTLDYDIVLYSRVSPQYLDIMTDVLDRDSVYRKAGCLTSVYEDDDIGKKHLHPILKNREVVCILDCRESGWEKYADNLIKIDPYCYFVTKARANNNLNLHLPKSWIQLKGDECEEGGELYRVLRVLSVAHIFFFKPDSSHDIRQVIHNLKSQNKLYKYRTL
ncbi:hypothetical protein BVRB_5g123060 [Beta vulgaris subsp. vulgaris]|uniref:protein-serine/threonine phosphatase n=1 Tax=Beta vulgaris subsp. vulgaris TaxID=3555 RepID=A0A0J8BAB9_BETVV|nr:RNA polymerase II C-terminal domain phosphatase-like 4 [Beta vulgaris subsp. vulgaris]KMS97876.1 hypothetical protein BVRB_5g123060 [Beta vulgaris subsp. vulgaris]